MLKNCIFSHFSAGSDTRTNFIKFLNFWEILKKNFKTSHTGLTQIRLHRLFAMLQPGLIRVSKMYWAADVFFVAPVKSEIKNQKLCEKSEKSAAKWV